jgi:peptidoglycan/xylan/chitin deacetylase (PgdA/CDA1 family)
VNGAGIPVLMYHEVSPQPQPAFRRYTVTPREFARQMRWLSAFGYHPIDMSTLVLARQGQGSLPRRPIIITFDDGLQGSVDYAVPVLQRHEFTAVFYLVAGLMGETSRWLRAELGIELPLMSWDTARGLAANGFECGGHTLTHPRLAELAPARRRTELLDSRARLEQELGRPIVHLAYPFGSFDAHVRQAAADAGYVSACSTQQGLSGPNDDLLALHRVPVYGHETLVDFACRLRTARSLPDRVRRVVKALAGRVVRPVRG